MKRSYACMHAHTYIHTDTHKYIHTHTHLTILILYMNFKI